MTPRHITMLRIAQDLRRAAPQLQLHKPALALRVAALAQELEVILTEERRQQA